MKSKKLGKDKSNSSKSIEYIKNSFNLTENELQKILKFPYGQVKPTILDVSRAFDLFIITRAWIKSGYPTDKESLHRPILDGLSTFELLLKDVLDEDLILFGGSRLVLINYKQR